MWNIFITPDVMFQKPRKPIVTLLSLCLQESPSNKLLYAKEISTYKKMVDE